MGAALNRNALRTAHTTARPRFLSIAESITPKVEKDVLPVINSLTLQSACSTSLLAIAKACQSLLLYESDMALAGGVSITLPQKRGYQYLEGGMASSDGTCRPFDADASGTIFGSGAGVVLLKRLEDAQQDGDHIYAVVRAVGLSSDGKSPSVNDGRCRSIAHCRSIIQYHTIIHYPIITDYHTIT